jgi:SPOR domain
MAEKDDKNSSEDGAYSDSLEIFDDIFSEGTASGDPDTKKGQPRPTTPPVKGAVTTVKKAEKGPAPPKTPPAKMAAPPAQQIKKAPPAQPVKPKEKVPVADSKDESPSESQELFDSIFSEGASADGPDTRKEQPRPTTPPVKESTPKQVQKTEQRPALQQTPPVKKTAPPAQQIKKAPSVEQVKPKEKLPDKEPQEKSSSESQELFDSIFSEREDAAPAEGKKEQPRPTAPPVKAPASKQVRKGSTLTEPVKKAEQIPVPPKVTPMKEAALQAQVIKSERSFEPDTYLDKRPDKDKGSGKKEIEKIDLYEKPRKSLSLFIVVPSIIVLVILALLAGMFIEDRSGIIRGIKTARDSGPEKKAPSGTDIDAKYSPVIDKELKMKKPDIQASQQLKEEIPPVIDQPPSAVPAPIPDKVIPREEVKSLSYPYSIYLGSYDSIESVKKATMNYEEKGLTPYWIKIDLGQKGVWFRLYADYFQTREEADGLIKTKQLPDAETKKTNYVNLIGIYSSLEEAYRQKEVIENLGYSPYVISDNKSAFRLYVGAFYQKDQAEELNSELLQKGIKGRVVER